jgi:hypothetical protein
METTAESLTSETTVVTRKCIESVVIGDKVAIYRLTKTTTSDKKPEPRVSVTEGVTSKKGIDAFREGAETLPHYAPGQAAVLGTPALVEAMRTHGWLDDEFHALIRAEIDTPYTRWASGGYTAEDIILFEGGAHMTYDWQGVPMSCAIAFDYISARMNDGQYDLKRALEILKARSDIRFWGADSWEKDGEVRTVPGYNRSSGCREFISFVWMPSREDYLKMWARACSYGNKTHSSVERYRAIFDEDLLGLRAGGAARNPDFYGHVVDDTSEEEEED